MANEESQGVSGRDASAPANGAGAEDRTFLLVIVVVSLAFALIIWPFFGAVLWGVILAILFRPVYRKILGWSGHRANIAAAVTLVLIVVMVILPLSLTIASLVNEVSAVYQKVQSGQLDFRVYFQRVLNSLPDWATGLLARYEVTNLDTLQERLSSSIAAGSKVLVTQAINVGQNTFNFVISLFVMLYLLFFLLRDGDVLYARIKETIPLRRKQKRTLLDNFAVVIRATVKGTLVIAILQGILGGIIFWLLGIDGALLWGVIMAILSLLPAVGAAVVWLPAAIYLIAIGSLWKGIILILYGVLVIGLVDNFLRPMLVGKDTKIPDYVILISTLGGLAIFGVNGFVIGPVIAALFIAVWNISFEARKQAPVQSPPETPAGTNC